MIEEKINWTLEKILNEENLLKMPDKGIVLPKNKQLIFLSNEHKLIRIAYGQLVDNREINKGVLLEIPYMGVLPPQGPGFNIVTLYVPKEVGSGEEQDFYPLNTSTDKILLKTDKNLKAALSHIGYGAAYLDRVVDYLNMQIPE